MLTYQIAQSITDVDPAQWDAVAGHDITLTHRWLRVLERTWHNTSSRYLLFREQTEVVAVATMDGLTAPTATGRLNQLLRRGTLFATPPFSSTGCGILIRPGLDRARLLPQVTAQLEQLMWQEKRPLLMVNNLAPQDLPLWEAAHFVPSAQPCVSLLDLPADYATYLQLLDKKDRAELRRIRRRATEHHITFEQGPLNGDGAEIYPLLCAVFAQHGTPIPFTPAFFTALEADMPGQVHLIKGFVDGQLAGVSFCLRHGSALWWPMVGLAYALARPNYLYFLLMDEMVQWSIQQGISRIYGGITAEQEKRKHGFYRQPRWLGYRAQPAVLNQLIKVGLPLAKRYWQTN